MATNNPNLKLNLAVVANNTALSSSAASTATSSSSSSSVSPSPSPMSPPHSPSSGFNSAGSFDWTVSESQVSDYLSQKPAPSPSSTTSTSSISALSSSRLTMAEWRSFLCDLTPSNGDADSIIKLSLLSDSKATAGADSVSDVEFVISLHFALVCFDECRARLPEKRPAKLTLSVKQCVKKLRLRSAEMIGPGSPSASGQSSPKSTTVNPNNLSPRNSGSSTVPSFTLPPAAPNRPQSGSTAKDGQEKDNGISIQFDPKGDPSFSPDKLTEPGFVRPSSPAPDTLIDKTKDAISSAPGAAADAAKEQLDSGIIAGIQALQSGALVDNIFQVVEGGSYTTSAHGLGFNSVGISLTSGISLQLDGPMSVLASLFQAIVRIGINAYIAAKSDSFDERRIVESLKDDLTVVNEKLDKFTDMWLKTAAQHLRKAIICLSDATAAGGAASPDARELIDEAKKAFHEAEVESARAIEVHQKDPEKLIQAYYVNVMANYWTMVDQRTRAGPGLEAFARYLEGRMKALNSNPLVVSAVKSQAEGASILGFLFGDKAARMRVIRSLAKLSRSIEVCFYQPSTASSASQVASKKLLYTLRRRLLRVRDDEKEIDVDARWMNWTLREMPTCALTLKGHTDQILAVIRLSADLIATASWDSSVRIWRVSTGTCVAELRRHQNHVVALERMTDGIFVSASHDRTLRAWKVEEAPQQQVAAANATAPNGSPTADREISDLEKERSNGKDKDEKGPPPLVVNTYYNVLEGHKGAVHCLQRMSDDVIASGSEDTTVRVWALSSRRCLQVLTGHSRAITCLLRLDETRLVSGGADQSLRIWNVQTGKCVAELREHAATISRLKRLTDKVFISGDVSGVLCAFEIAGNSGEIRSLQKFRSELAGVLRMEDGITDIVAVSAHHFVSSSRNGWIRIWRVAKTEREKDKERSKDVSSASRDSRDVEKKETETAVHTIPVSLSGRRSPSLSGRSRNDTNSTASSYGSEVKDRPNGDNGSCVRAMKIGGGVSCLMQFTEDLLLSGGGSGKLALWEMSSGKCLNVIESHADRVVGMVRAGSDVVVTAGGDKKVCIWTA